MICNKHTQRLLYSTQTSNIIKLLSNKQVCLQCSFGQPFLNVKKWVENHIKIVPENDSSILAIKEFESICRKPSLITYNRFSSSMNKLASFMSLLSA